MTNEARYDEMERVLKVILVHSTFQNGKDLDPVMIERLCRKALGRAAIKK